ncbi:ATP-binding protein, partial [Enterobacter roggenkampii]
MENLELLFLDDWGLVGFEAALSNDLMDFMVDRDGLSSNFILSQIPNDDLYLAIGYNTLAFSILVRLMH